MSAVAPIYDAWGNRASRKEPECVANGERVFRVGGYTITVPDDHDEPAKVASVYNRWGASENPMPNLSFSDGEMRIPVEDFVDLILRRVPADELAEGLWRDESVRERFVYCMGERYSGGGISDDDRRSVLRQMQVAIHAAAIDRAVDRLNKLESNARSYTDRFRWAAIQNGFYSGLYDAFKGLLFEMREAGLLTDEQIGQRIARHTTPERVVEFYQESADPIMRESVGTQWTESRDFWRDQLMALFPEPDPASVDERPEGQDAEERLGAEPASAVPCADTADAPPTPEQPQ